MRAVSPTIPEHHDGSGAELFAPDDDDEDVPDGEADGAAGPGMPGSAVDKGSLPDDRKDRADVQGPPPSIGRHGHVGGPTGQVQKAKVKRAVSHWMRRQLLNMRQKEAHDRKESSKVSLKAFSDHPLRRRPLGMVDQKAKERQGRLEATINRCASTEHYPRINSWDLSSKEFLQSFTFSPQIQFTKFSLCSDYLAGNTYIHTGRHCNWVLSNSRHEDLLA